MHGYPGSGKTTQCERVAREAFPETTIQHISLGDRLRSIRQGKTTSQYELPALSPPSDTVANDVIFEAFEDNADIILIDGYPRHASAVDTLAASLLLRQQQLLGTVVLHIDEHTSAQRLVARGLREGEVMDAVDIKDHARHRYHQDSHRIGEAIAALGRIAPIAWIEAALPEDEVQAQFRRALGQLTMRTISTHI